MFVLQSESALKQKMEVEEGEADARQVSCMYQFVDYYFTQAYHNYCIQAHNRDKCT